MDDTTAPAQLTTKTGPPENLGRRTNPWSFFSDEIEVETDNPVRDVSISELQGFPEHKVGVFKPIGTLLPEFDLVAIAENMTDTISDASGDILDLLGKEIAGLGYKNPKHEVPEDMKPIEEAKKNEYGWIHQQQEKTEANVRRAEQATEVKNQAVAEGDEATGLTDEQKNQIDGTGNINQERRFTAYGAARLRAGLIKQRNAVDDAEESQEATEAGSPAQGFMREGEMLMGGENKSSHFTQVAG